MQLSINPAWLEKAVEDCEHGPILAISPEIYSEICDEDCKKKDHVFLVQGYKKIDRFEYGAVIEVRKKPLIDRTTIIYWR
jgi:hypothetical protein